MTYQGVHSLIGCFTGFKSVVYFMSPRTHLDRTNEIGVDDGLFV